jgi:hypothetical protein
MAGESIRVGGINIPMKQENRESWFPKLIHLWNIESLVSGNNTYTHNLWVNKEDVELWRYFVRFSVKFIWTIITWRYTQNLQISETYYTFADINSREWSISESKKSWSENTVSFWVSSNVSVFSNVKIFIYANW